MAQVNVYQIVTERILAQLQAGAVPWQRPWSTLGPARSAVTSRPYRGINVWLLATSTYHDPRWLTFRQALEKGGNVRKGEHGYPVVFWKLRDAGEEEAEDTHRGAPILRYYTVFSIEQ